MISIGTRYRGQYGPQSRTISWPDYQLGQRELCEATTPARAANGDANELTPALNWYRPIIQIRGPSVPPIHIRECPICRQSPVDGIGGLSYERLNPRALAEDVAGG